MGVHGLWELLAPVGRRVSVETLAGKKLAIDASIWMIQFIMAMRDEKGEMVRNAHILGFFRRICKLLYLRTKPVFVFDGGTPALKRRTVIARRRQRENAQAKIRKTAEKLLLNHLKTMRAKELASDLQKQRQENDVKGKRPVIMESTTVQSTEKVRGDSGISYSQEQLDEMLAASLAAEENEASGFDATTSGAAVSYVESFIDGEEEEDEEIILPEMQGRVDPAILAALPPSLQLDLLVQMRERLMAENRQKYQKVKKAPARFSELQIQAYLKTVAFRREIDVVQKSAAGRGIGGVQTSRIASEANREFIFSSSFTGDKQVLAAVAQGEVRPDQSEAPAVNISTKDANNVTQTNRSGNMAGSADVETGKAFPDDVETYLDERGNLRVSRLRALGVRMTRDLQRNLDLMKEIDQEKVVELEKRNECNTAETLVDVLDNSCARDHQEIMDNNNISKNDGVNDEADKTKEPSVINGTSFEISFEDLVEHEADTNDDAIFAHLVAGDPVIDFSVDKSATEKQALHTDSDIEWEEGDVIENRTENMLEGGINNKGEDPWEEGFVDNQKCSSCLDESQKNVMKGVLQEEVDSGKQSLDSGSDVEWEEGGIKVKRTTNMSGRSMDDVGVEWEEGFRDIQESLSYPNESKKNVTKGTLEEEADLQEAIRRSLVDTKDCRSMADIPDGFMCKRSQDMLSEPIDQVEGKEKHGVEAPAKNVCQPFGTMNILGTNVPEAEPAAYVELNHEKNVLPEEKALSMTGKQLEDICSEDSNVHAMKQVDTSKGEVVHDGFGIGSNSSYIDSLPGRVPGSCSAEAPSLVSGTLDDSSSKTMKYGDISADGILNDADGAKELAQEKIQGSVSIEKDELIRYSSFVDNIEEQEILKGHLEEEIMFLGKEREDLGIEQRKLERNAEAVSSEMFAECQEMLQMFGLPYIIAPMEAEAQCAFMEMSNLVDGVVTDDSDAFLFGAQSVYKNIFDDRKYVETYLMKDIENELGLDQEKLIRMALLLGSDYTEGISGIGIVNAIEVMNAFPEKDGLREFREWIESPDPAILGKLSTEPGSNSRRKGSKSTENNMSGSSSKIGGNSCGDQNVPETADEVLKIKQVFMDKHRNVSKNWHIPSKFPSDAVISAYASPQVDKSTEPFAWGKPDLHVLRKLCWEKIGWSAAKADELLLPVLKEYNKHETQLRLEAFYSFNERFAKIRSKRIKTAVKGMAVAKSSELMDEMRPQKSGSGNKRKVKHGEDEVTQSVGSTVIDATGTDAQNNAVEKPTGKKCRGGSRGKGKGQQSGRGRRKKNSTIVAESSYNGRSNDETDEEMQVERTEESQEVRRSRRLRNTVNYAVSDESDDLDKETEASIKEGLFARESLIDLAIGSINEKNDGNELSSDIGISDELFAEENEQAYTIDETTTIQTNDIQIDDTTNQSQLSQDYLQSGGGFCIEEEDEQMESNQHGSNPTAETDSPKSTDPWMEALGINPPVAPRSPLNGKTPVSDTELNMNNNDMLSDDNDDPEDTCGDGNGKRALRAMPNLRRKKRKT